MDDAENAGPGESAPASVTIPPSPDVSVEPAPAQRRRFVLLRDHPLDGGSRFLPQGAVIEVPTQRLSEFGEDIARPATDAEVSMAEPGVITLEP